MQNLYFSLSLFDAQTWYVRDVILGRIPFPNKLQRAEDMLSWKTREEKIKDKLDALDFQTAYLKELTSATDYPLDDLRLSGTAATFKNFLDDKESNIINYRDKQYTSSITGTKAVMHPTPWMEVNNYSSVDFL
jgi:trimethylamine monooxygenase